MPADLTLLHCDHMPDCTATVDKHFVGYTTLQFMTDGGIELSYDDDTYELRGAWLWLCFPGPHIRFHAHPRDGRWHHRYVAFTGPGVSEWERMGLLFTRPQAPPKGQTARFVTAFDHLLEQARRTDRFGRLRAANLLEQLLLELAETRQATPVERSAWLSDVMRELETFTDREPDYDALARRLSMSLSTLRRRFNEATGLALHAYRLNVRIAAARALLGDTDLPIKDIARRLGYRDVFYFTRQFTEKAGTSPSVYRKSRQA